jgi:hypothetical protein
MRGGKRQGAGRKQGFAAKNAEEARRILSDMVLQEIAPIGKALITKAKKGDVAAVRELFDRAFGKAPQTAKVDFLEHRLPTPIMGGLNFDPSFMREEDLREIIEERDKSHNAIADTL